MGSYNVKVYEYATGIQVRLYNQVLTYSEKVKKEPFLQSDEKIHAHELLPERKEISLQKSISRTISQIYEVSRANTWEYFITLTFNRKLLDSSDYDLLCDKVSIWFNNLKKRYAPDLKYLIVPELHADGIHYHFHGLLSNVGNIKFIDSGIKKKGHVIYNMLNWKYGWSTATKVADTARVSSYITKYITKELCSVTKYKKRYWHSRNCNTANVKIYNLPYEEIDKIFEKNLHLLQHVSTKKIKDSGLIVTYVELKKENQNEC